MSVKVIFDPTTSLLLDLIYGKSAISILLYTEREKIYLHILYKKTQNIQTTRMCIYSIISPKK